MKRILRLSVISICVLLWLVAISAQAAPTQAQINAAIERGLAWLATQQQPDGHFGDNYPLGGTAMVVLAFEEKGHLPGTGAQYSDIVERGLDFIFERAGILQLEAQPAGDPDSDVDGQGVYFNWESTGYETGACLMAIVASKSPDRIVTTGFCSGMTYSDVVRDAVDYYAYAQADQDEWRGGWRYGENADSDNSVSQWPTHAMILAEGWGIKAPSWVKSEFNNWVNFIQTPEGGSGYQYPEDPNLARTGALLMEMYWLLDNQNTPRVQRAISFINNQERWEEAPDGYVGNKGNSYAMFTVFKGLRMMNVQSLPNAVPGGNWWGDYTQWIVDNQNSDGYWEALSYNNWLDAAWYIMILQGTLPVTVSLTVQASPTSIPADGSSTSTITATVKNASGNPMSGLNVTMVATKNLGEVGTVQDNGNGTYTAAYRAATTPGKETISVSVSGAAKTVDITLTQVQPTTIVLTLSASPSSLPADGISTSTVTATVRDSNGNPMSGQSLSMAITQGQGTLSSVQDNGGGTYTATYTASTVAGTVTIRATVAGVSQTVSITLTPTGIQPGGRKLIIKDATGTPGQDVTVSIEISDAAGVNGADITVSFDTNILSFKEVKTTTLSSGLTIAGNVVGSDLLISMAGSSPISSGSGAIINMVFAVSSGAKAGTQTPLTFKSASVFDANLQTIPVTTQNGKVTIGGACVKGDVFKDGKIDARDAALVLKYIVKQVELTPEQICAAAVTPGDEVINAADAIFILQVAVGLRAKPAPGRDSMPITVTLDEVYGEAGKIITVPVKVDNTDILAGGNICVAYNSSVLRAVGAASESDMLFADNTNEPGMVRIAFASADRIIGETIANISFEVLSDDVSSLTLKSVELYGFDALPLNSRAISKGFASYLSRPKYSALLQNFPNPFNPETWIPYQVKENCEVTIWILNATGEIVRKLDLGYKSAGLYINKDRAAYWDGKDNMGALVSSGVYFYSIKAGDLSAVRKMIILK